MATSNMQTEIAYFLGKCSEITPLQVCSSFADSYVTVRELKTDTVVLTTQILWSEI